MTAEKKKTILIIGVSSFIGSNLAEYFKHKYRVVGTYRENAVSIKGVLTVPCNVLEKDEIQLVLFAFKPDITIYCAGLSSLVDCAASEAKADSLNTVGLFNVAEYCQRYKSQVVAISCGYVFGGENKEYQEMDIPDSSTIFGKTKASAEFYIQKTSLNYLIFRCCPLYGRGLNPYQMTLFERIQRKFKRSESMELDGYVYTGFLDVYYLAMLMDLCFDKGVTNRLYQVSSRDAMSFYQFAEIYCNVFGENNTLITRGRWPFPYVVTSTSNYSGGELYYRMSVKNIEGFLSVRLPTVEESLQLTYKRLGGRDRSTRRQTSNSGVTFI